jgi:CRP-like cAMP-binding protein
VSLPPFLRRAPLLDTRRANRILSQLRHKDYQRLRPALEEVTVRFGQVLYQPGDRIEHVYFPNDSLVSLVAMAGDKQVAEVGIIGSEGAVGGSAALGIGISPFRAIVQGAGTAMRIKASQLSSKTNEARSLQGPLLKFSHLLTAQVAQTAACNRFHVVSARLARWLLMTRDRLLTNEFRLTQEFLAHMLGVQRAGVSRAASVLKKKKIIRYSRGRITILNHKELVAASCRCYQQVKKLYDHA